MSLFKRIETELKESMLARDVVKTETLRMFKSAVKYVVIESKGADGVADDNDVLAVARKQVKQRQDSIASYQQAGRADLAAKEEAEMKILTAFLPAQMDEAELETLVKAALAEVGVTSKKEMGKAMKAVMEKVAGRADGKAVSAMVQKCLV